jgi:hypothetical protein
MSGAQLTLDAALANTEKQYGLDQVELHHLPFVTAMRKMAAAVAKREGQVTCDRLRFLAAGFGLKPDHPNAWGAIFRGKDWRCIGREPSQVVSNHAREIKVWAYQQSN